MQFHWYLAPSPTENFVAHPRRPDTSSWQRWSRNHILCCTSTCCADFALCLHQIRSPCLLCCLGDIGGDHHPIHVVVELEAVGSGLCDCGGELFEICCGTLLSIKCRCHHVHHHMPDRCCVWSFGATRDGAEQLMERILIDHYEIRSIFCAKDWVGDLCSDNHRDLCRNFFIYSNFREPCGVLPICLVLSVGVGCDFGGDDVG